MGKSESNMRKRRERRIQRRVGRFGFRVWRAGARPNTFFCTEIGPRQSGKLKAETGGRFGFRVSGFELGEAVSVVAALQACRILVDVFPALQAGLSHNGLSALGTRPKVLRTKL